MVYKITPYRLGVWSEKKITYQIFYIIHHLCHLYLCGLPFVLILTKADKVKEHEMLENMEGLKNALLEYWDELPRMVVTSANTKLGREEVLSIIDEANTAFDTY